LDERIKETVEDEPAGESALVTPAIKLACGFVEEALRFFPRSEHADFTRCLPR